MIKVFSNTANEDAVSLLMTLEEFQAHRVAKNVWHFCDDTIKMPLLHHKLAMCFSGQAAQQWHAVMGELAGKPKTWPAFKCAVAKFIAHKTI